jgi:RimJ/RimL family protein N-acetyltransferase
MPAMTDEPALGEPIDWRPVAPPARTELRGERVLLRPLDAAGDAPALHRVSHPPLADPELWTYLPSGPYPDAGAMERDLMVAAASLDPLFFTLALLPDARPAGVASYLRITPQHGVIEIGHIWFGAELRRTPAASETIFLLAAHAFDELGYRRLEWKCNALNAGSRRAAERFGFRFEGVFRNHMVVKGRNRDTAWYAMTDDEWPAVRAGFQAWLAADNFDERGAQRRRLSDLIAAARNS